MAMKLTQPRKVLQVLRGAIGLCNDSGCWTRYALARDEAGRPVSCTGLEATQFCLSGALHRSCVDQGIPAEAALEADTLMNQVCIGTYKQMISKHGAEEDLWEFDLFPLSYTNDSLLYSHKNALELLQKVHDLLEKRVALQRTPAAATPPPPPAAAPPAEPEDPATADDKVASADLSAAPPAEPEDPATADDKVVSADLSAAPPAKPEDPATADDKVVSADLSVEIVQDPVQHDPSRQQAEADAPPEPSEPLALAPLPKIALPGIEIDMDLDDPG